MWGSSDMKLYADQQLLIDDVDVANSYFKRLRGMIRRPISALYIPRCNSIHTFFMHKSIDVLFLNKQLKIIYIPFFIYYYSGTCSDQDNFDVY